MTKYEYAQLFTYLRDGFHTAAFIDPEGRSQEWPPENYNTIHLNRAGNDGWRVVNEESEESGNVAYLLERERQTQGRLLA